MGTGGLTADVLGAAAGVWGRTEARAVFVPRTSGGVYAIGHLGERPWVDPDDPLAATGLWIVAYEHGASYRLDQRGALALEGLLALAGLPAGEETTAEAVARWVADFGQPTDPDGWLDDAYLAWCDRRRLREAADFARWWAARKVWPEEDQGRYRAAPPFVPVDRVRWLAECLTALRDAVMADRPLPTDVRAWADGRLGQLLPKLGATAGRIVLAPRSLEAHLTARVALHVHGEVVVRACRSCGQEFTVMHGRQRYCNQTCRNRFSQQAARQRKAAR